VSPERVGAFSAAVEVVEDDAAAPAAGGLQDVVLVAAVDAALEGEVVSSGWAWSSSCRQEA
jgi:hypothetical protein